MLKDISEIIIALFINCFFLLLTATCVCFFFKNLLNDPRVLVVVRLLSLLFFFNAIHPVTIFQYVQSIT